MAKGNSVKIRIDGDASDLEKKLKNIGNVAKAGLADVKAGIDLATQAVKTFASVAEKGIGYNATIEQLKTSFEVMTGSAEKAVEVTERLRTMGAETPFEMKDLASTTQLLMQYGFTADEALDRMKMLGDVAQGNVNAMNSIALGYAQMASAGKVNLVDIKQMINGGFNPLQEISERTGESMASLYDRISKGKISVDEITESMRHATSEGGRFYQSMEKQSQTLNGQLSTLKDNADQLLGSLTQGVSDGLRDQLLPFANNLVAELQGAFDAGGYQGLVDTATDMIPDLLGMMTGELQKGIEGLSRWLPKGASQLMQALPGALRMASTVTPQLTQALFEVAGSVLGDLVGMLPELAPIVGKGLWDLFISASSGIIDAVGSVQDGLTKALKDVGAIAPTAAEAFQSLVDNVDQATIDKLKKTVDVDINTEVTVDDYQTKIDTALDNIENALKTVPGLSEGEQEAIKNAIIKGSGLDVIQIAFNEFGVDSSAAVSAIQTAQSNIDAVVSGLGLSEPAASHIRGLIENNADSASIQEAIASFGIDPGAAGEAAKSITTEMGALDTTLQELGIPATTISTLRSGLFTDKRLVVGALQLLGLDEDNIKTVTDSYSTVAGTLTAGIDGIYQSIANLFTDGIPESNTDVQQAKAKIEGIALEAQTRVDKWYADKVAELQASGLKGDVLNQELLNAKMQYDTLSESIETTTGTMLSQTESMVGQSTEYCKQQVTLMGQTVDELKDLTAQIDMLTSEDMTAAQTSRALTIEGVTTDQGTQLEAFLVTYKEYTDKIRVAEEEYLAAITQARQTYEAGGSESEYASAEEAARQQLESAKQHAADYYQQYTDMILAGMMMADPAVSAAMQEAVQSKAISNLASELSVGLKNAFEANAAAGEEIITLEDVLGDLNIDETSLANIADLIGIDPEQLYNQIVAAFKIDDTTFAGEAGALPEQIESTIATMLTGDGLDFSGIVPTLATAIESGYLIPGINGIDYSNAASIWNTTLSSVLEITDALHGQATEAGESLVTDAETGADGSGTSGKGLGGDFGSGFVSGIAAWVTRAYSAAYSLARAAVRGGADGQDSASPSKEAKKLGKYFGEGYTIGLQDSMANAIAVAKRMTGQVVTAADISQSMRVNIPTLQQDIILANEQSDRSVNLYVNGKELGRVMAADNQIAQNRYNRTIAMGVGK